ncbi:MAG: putative sulfate exporter family transporter [Verrucomicrobiota bacterium]
MRWSEDWVAVWLGGGLLILATGLFVAFPVWGIETASLAEFIEGLSSRFATWQWSPLGTLARPGWVGMGILLSLLLALGTAMSGKPVRPFVKGFVFVFGLAVVAKVLASQADFKSAGLGYALWAIALGLIIRNGFGLPSWVDPALQHELFVKIGLVLLGAEVLFGKVLAIGLPGIFVAWVVTPIVLVSTYWFGQHILKISSKSLNLTISADMSVCGVSAAIATAAACKAKKEELTTAVGLSMAFTSLMMVAMPALIKAVGMPEVLGGAWMGGTIDATGAVVAAGAFLGERALNVAATIKMIQNILIGVIAFAVAVYWTTRVERSEGQASGIQLSEIWKRFPKFILGFAGASLFFSLLHQSLGAELAASSIEDGLYGFSKSLRGWLFALAFVSIGLSTDFKVLRAQFSGGKPLILYLCGQSFNLILTLLVAWLMFYVVFPGITESI